jgi:hypothetical protein
MEREQRNKENVELRDWLREVTKDTMVLLIKVPVPRGGADTRYDATHTAKYSCVFVCVETRSDG